MIRRRRTRSFSVNRADTRLPRTNHCCSVVTFDNEHDPLRDTREFVILVCLISRCYYDDLLVVSFLFFFFSHSATLLLVTLLIANINLLPRNTNEI